MSVLLGYRQGGLAGRRDKIVYFQQFGDIENENHAVGDDRHAAQIAATRASQALGWRLNQLRRDRDELPGGIYDQADAASLLLRHDQPRASVIGNALEPEARPQVHGRDDRTRSEERRVGKELLSGRQRVRQTLRW